MNIIDRADNLSCLVILFLKKVLINFNLEKDITLDQFKIIIDKYILNIIDISCIYVYMMINIINFIVNS